MGTSQRKGDRRAARVITFFVMAVFWLVFSGKLDLFHLTLGLICCALTAFVSHDLLITNTKWEKRLTKCLRFALYVPWLIYQIILANFHVAYLVLNPKRIHPHVIRFKTKLKNDMSIVTLANSITLTPGTITMDIEGDELVVHALSKKVADDLLGGEMEERVARIFLENEEAS